MSRPKAAPKAVANSAPAKPLRSRRPPRAEEISARDRSPRRRTQPDSKQVVILSRKQSLYSTARLVEAAQIRGHGARVLDTLQCSMVLERSAPRLLYGGQPLDRPDVVIPRIGASITPYGLAVVNHLDMMGVPLLNNSVPIARSRDKLRCLQLLARFGIDIPRTVMAHDRSDVERLVQEVGGLPAIIKLSRGTQGVGVMIASTLAEVRSILDTFWDLGQEIVLQEFIQESRGIDVRALVVGNRVVGAMRRRAKRGEFRSNLHRGGAGTAVTLPSEYVAAAVRAAEVVGLEVAGVDMLEARSGPKVMEVNSSPGLEGVEKATRVDIAGAIIEHAVAYAGARREGWVKERLI